MPELSTFCPSIQRLQCRVCPEGCVSTSIYSVAEASLYLCRNRALLLIWKKRHNESCSFFFLVSPLPKSFLSPIKAPILSSGRFIFVWFFSISVGVFYHPRSSRPRSLQAGISTALHSRWLFLGSQDDGSGEKSPSEVRSTIWLWLT